MLSVAERLQAKRKKLNDAQRRAQNRDHPMNVCVATLKVFLFRAIKYSAAEPAWSKAKLDPE